jgi:hypothetical protein
METGRRNWIELFRWSGLDCAASKALDKIKTMLDLEGIDNERAPDTINLHGITFKARVEVEEEPLQIRVDPGLADIALPIIERAIREVRTKDGVRGVRLRLDFDQTVDCIELWHKVTGRIYGTDVKLGSGDELVRQDIRFRTGRSPSGLQGRGSVYIVMDMLSDQIPTDQMRELLAFLFDRELLFLSTEIGRTTARRR